MEIKLTDADFDHCVKLTETHLLESKNRGASNQYGMPKNLDFEYTLQGYLGEQAVANYFNYQTVYRKYKKSDNDVLGYEVRTVYYAKAILITHLEPDDKPGIYICVSVNKNEMIATLKGWSTLERCNNWKSNWRTNWRHACFGMDEQYLWPIDLLPATDELLQHQNRLAA